MSEKEINLTLTVEELNTILSALSKLPFADVYGIIHKIHQQAAAQATATHADLSADPEK
jgi:hypothetical protein